MTSTNKVITYLRIHTDAGTVPGKCQQLTLTIIRIKTLYLSFNLILGAGRRLKIL